MNVTVSVDSVALQRAFRIAPMKVQLNLQSWISRSALKTERLAKVTVSDRVDTGRLQSSIHSSFGYLAARVRPNVDYAQYVEEGRRPGKFPPFGERTSLNSWARRRGLDPFLVARSIAKKGTKGDHFMSRTYKQVKPEIENDGVRMVSNIVRSI